MRNLKQKRTEINLVFFEFLRKFEIISGISSESSPQTDYVRFHEILLIT